MGIESGTFEAPQETADEKAEREGARIYVEVKNALMEIDPNILNSERNADRKEDLKRMLHYALEQLEK